MNGVEKRVSALPQNCRAPLTREHPHGNKPEFAGKWRDRNGKWLPQFSKVTPAQGVVMEQDASMTVPTWRESYSWGTSL